MSEALHILEMIETGEIDVAEAVRLLTARDDGGNPADSWLGVGPAGADGRGLPFWAQVAWQGAFWFGAALVVAGAPMLWATYGRGEAPGWAIAGWALFFLGVALILAGWWMRQAHWLRVRVRENGRLISVMAPIPVGASARVLRWAGRFAPGPRRLSLVETLSTALERVDGDEPIAIHIRDDDDGSEVDVSLCRRS